MAWVGGAAMDKRYLVLRRQTWSVVVEVPPSLQAKLGRRIRRSLKTRDLHVARAKRWQAVADIRAEIEAARRVVVGDPLHLEAMAYRAALVDETNRSDREAAKLDWDTDAHEHEDIRTDNILREHIAERAVEIEARQGYQTANTFAGIALGTLTPLETYVEDWLREGGIKGALTERTKLSHRRAVKELSEWLTQANVEGSLEGISRRVAGRYVSEHLLPSGRHKRTISKTISTLSGYWKWLRQRGHVADDDRNPWSEQAPPRSNAAADIEPERAFTDAELLRLLASPPNITLADFMLMATLTGMRREEIGLLKVGDCTDGVFIIRASKTAAGRRRVPIHSGLVSLVARRSEGKAGTAFLFNELASKHVERTDHLGKRFARYRRSLGIQDGEGRRSLTNFHSFRRWHITSAVNAGQPPHVVSLVVGHTEGRKGMTLGRYWQGSEDDALRACVEAVKLPDPSLLVQRGAG
jgi:site-specific recombinase XerD